MASRASVVSRACPPRASKEPQHPAPSKALHAIETAALLLAVGAHAGAWAGARQRQQERNHAGTARPAPRQRSVAEQASVAAELPALAPGAPTAPGWSAPGSLWMTLPLLVALISGRLAAMFRCHRQPPLALGAADKAAARLLRTEALAAQQDERLGTLARQVDKLQTRARLTGRDLRGPIKQLEAGAAEQTAVLAGLAQRLDATERDVRDVEQLLAALQALSSKQFDLLAAVLQRQQAAGQAVGHVAAARHARAQPKLQTRPGQAETPPGPTAAQQQQQHSSGLEWHAATQPASPQPRGEPVQAGQPAPQLAQQQKQQTTPAGGQRQGPAGGTDEWGRPVRLRTRGAAAAPTPAAPSQPTGREAAPTGAPEEAALEARAGDRGAGAAWAAAAAPTVATASPTDAATEVRSAPAGPPGTAPASEAPQVVAEASPTSVQQNGSAASHHATAATPAAAVREEEEQGAADQLADAPAGTDGVRLVRNADGTTTYCFD